MTNWYVSNQTQAALAAAAQAAQAAAIAAGLVGPDGEVIPEQIPEEEIEKSIQSQEEGSKVNRILALLSPFWSHCLLMNISCYLIIIDY